VFTFLDFPLFRDESLVIRLARMLEADPERGYVPSYVYHIYEPQGLAPIGYIDLRIGENENLFYGGHIGYRIHEDFRGHGYAGKACRLIVPLAKAHGMQMLRITCNPDNLASKRTIEKLGAKLIGVFPVPPHNEMYQNGETVKCVFEWLINESDEIP